MISLVRKTEIQSFVSVLLSRLSIRLIHQLFRRCHTVPNLFLLLVEAHQVLPLNDEDDQTEGKDGHTHGVARLVVWSIPFAVNLTPDETPTISKLALYLVTRFQWDYEAYI